MNAENLVAVSPRRVAPLLVAVMALLSGSSLVAQSILVVPDTHATIQAAVDAALATDTVLIEPGKYDEAVIVDGKGVSLVGDKGAVGLSSLIVRNLPAGQTVYLEMLEVEAETATAEALLAVNNAGSIRVQDSLFIGASGTMSLGQLKGHDAVVVSGCPDLVFHHCSFRGGDGANLSSTLGATTAGQGGLALSITASNVAVSNSELTGGSGGTALPGSSGNGGAGGAAVGNQLGLASVSGSLVEGGAGGAGAGIAGLGGIGGDGLHQPQAPSSLWSRGNALNPGAGGAHGDSATTALAGQAVNAAAGKFVSFASAPSDLTIASPIQEGDGYSIQVDGPPGATVFLWFSFQTAFQAKGFLQGVFQLGFPVLVEHLPVGNIAGNGNFSLALAAPDDLGPGIDVVHFKVQTVLFDGTAFSMGPAAIVTVVDGSF